MVNKGSPSYVVFFLRMLCYGRVGEGGFQPKNSFPFEIGQIEDGKCIILEYIEVVYGF